MVSADRGRGAAPVRHVDVKGEEHSWPVIFSARAAISALSAAPAPEDTVIAADGGWRICREEGIVPDLLLGDFDSLHTVPDFGHIRRVPVEKDDTDMMLAIKEGLARGETDFRLYGGVGGRTDHTIANLQGLLYLAERGAQGWLYGDVCFFMIFLHL